MDKLRRSPIAVVAAAHNLTVKRCFTRDLPLIGRIELVHHVCVTFNRLRSPIMLNSLFTSLSCRLSNFARCLALSIGLTSLLTVLLMVGLTPTAQASAYQYDKVNLTGEDFSGQDLRDSSFVQANLRDANLGGVNLSGVSLFGANMNRSNLEGADLRYATLDSAQLQRVNLRNANLEGAFAFRTNFKDADVEGADFTDVLLDNEMYELLCKVADGVNPVTGRATRETLDCY